MGKKRKLTKEEKQELKTRSELGRLCKPGCGLVVYGCSFTLDQRLEMYASGIQIMFAATLDEAVEYLEVGLGLETPMTLFIRTPFAEVQTYFETDVEPMLTYYGKNIDVKIFGHTSSDHVLDKFGLRQDDMNDRDFYALLRRWAYYCVDKVGYGDKLNLLKQLEHPMCLADERISDPEMTNAVQYVVYDAEAVASKLALCAEEMSAGG